MTQIRQATRSDAALILDFIRRLAEYEKLAHEVRATPESIAQTLFTDPKPAEVLIAEYDGKPAGFALYFHNYSTFLAQRGIYLEDLFVLPELRGRGIGLALFNRVDEIAVERGCGRLEWAVLDWNQPAIDFYKRRGAKALSDWTVWRMAPGAGTSQAERT